jgi:hypothetical protein
MKKSVIAAALAAFVALPAVATAASASNWEFLGLRKVGTFVDRDTIRVGAAEGAFRKIRVKVRGNALWVYDLDIRYHNGARQDVPVRLRIPQGGQTRVIDLDGNQRLISNVTFTYGKLPNGAGATYIELWGQH